MSFLFALAGMSCLCLSMPRHQRDLFLRPLPPRWQHCLRWGGYVWLSASFAVALADGATHVVQWAGELSMAALASVALPAAALFLRRPGARGKR
ncbi:DUF3325 domain-containing protein [Novosphingobium beihaiensis]|uniref:DUF3325 domain-containing protein n=1 Tax=Novosphingobium beihaiensis TaxID=2930389 RepID=UPI0038994892